MSFPIRSGHGCIGCSEVDFWDKGPFYARQENIPRLDAESNADTVGIAAVSGVATAIGLHAAASVVRRIQQRREQGALPSKSDETADSG